MSDTYAIKLNKEQHVFSAAHFITFDGNVCERLHGHNYRVAVEVEGPLDENQYVIDFLALRDAVRSIVVDLDHYMLLPTGHPTIQVQANDWRVEVTFQDRRWEFPRGDCKLLPVENTTTELLARHIGRRLLDDLSARLGVRPEVLRIELDECYGQSAVCELRD